MKTLKLGGLALLLMSVFSCTKSNNLSQTQQVLKSVTKPTAPQTKVNPGLVVNFNPDPGVLGQQVTVTGTFDGTTAIPDCGKLHLFQVINGTATMVADVDVSSVVHSVSYQFTPTVTGDKAYQFYLQYVAGNCDGFSETQSQPFFLKVVEPCLGFNLTGKVLDPVPGTNGNYIFTVQYTVNACGIEYDYLKTQGGLTAFTSQVQDLTEGATTRETGNNNTDHPNTIITWEETSKLANNTKTYSITFQKPYSGSGTIELTGQWSVNANLNGVDQGTAICAPLSYTK